MAESKKSKAIAAARRAGGFAAKGVKGTIASAAIGGAAYYIDKAIGDSTSSTVQSINKRYVKPAAYIVGGHFLKRKPGGIRHDIGAGMVAIGGFLLAADFDADEGATETRAADTFSTGSSSPSTSTGTQPGAAPAQGFGDAGMLVDARGWDGMVAAGRGDAGMLVGGGGLSDNSGTSATAATSNRARARGATGDYPDTTAMYLSDI